MLRLWRVSGMSLRSYSTIPTWSCSSPPRRVLLAMLGQPLHFDSETPGCGHPVKPRFGGPWRFQPHRLAWMQALMLQPAARAG